MSEHPIALTEPPEGYAEWLVGLGYMRVFAGTSAEGGIRQQPVGQLPWGTPASTSGTSFARANLTPAQLFGISEQLARRVGQSKPQPVGIPDRFFMGVWLRQSE